MQAETESTPGVVPVHHRIADALRARIVTGELQPGDPVPSASELAEKWGCSTGSARAALTVLTSEGRISGGRGRKARVRQPSTRIRLSLDFTQHQKDLVLRPESERAATGAIELTAGKSINDTDFRHSYDRVPANAELANEFGIPEGSELLRREYENTDPASGVRLSWSQSFIPIALLESNPDLLNPDKEPWPGGHMHQLYTVGIEIDRMVRSVTAVAPTPADRTRWDVQPGVPLVVVRSRSVDTSDRVVEVSNAAYPADRVDLVFTEKLDRWPSGYSRYHGDKKNG